MANREKVIPRGKKNIIPLFILLFLLLVIGVALGLLIFLLNSLVPPIPQRKMVILDVFLVSAGISASLYILVYRQLTKYLKERDLAEGMLQMRARQQSAIARLSQRALSGEELPALFQETVSLVADTLQVEFAKILQRLPDGNALRLVAGVGWKEGTVGTATVSAGTHSQAGYTLLCNEPVVVEDLKTETRFQGPPLLSEHGVVSGMSVVIQGRPGPFGVLGAHTTHHRRFTSDDIDFLQAIANVVASAIERKETERKLQKMEEQFRGIVESTPDPVVISDRTGRIVLVNTQAEKLFGYPRDELLGQQHNILVPERLREKHNRSMAEYFAKPSVRPMGVGLELIGRKKDGSEVPVDVSLGPLETEEGLLVIADIHDITERKKMEEALKEKVQFLSTLYEIDRATSQAFSLQDTLTLGLKKTLDTLKADAGGIYLIELDGETLSLQVHSGISESLARQIKTLKIGGPHLSSRVVLQKKPVVTSIQEYPEGTYRKLFTEEKFHTFVAVPLISQEQVLGVLHLVTRSPRTFSPEEINHLRAIGIQLGSAAGAIFLLEREWKRSRQLMVVSQIALRSGGFTDESAFLNFVAQSLHRQFGYEDVAIFFYDKERKKLIRKTWAGVHSRTEEELRKPLEGKGVVDWVAIHGKPRLVPDVEKEPLYVAYIPETQSKLCVPILKEQKVIGVINIESHQKFAFDDVDVVAIQALANEVAVALSNIGLLEEKEKLLRRLSSLYASSRALTESLRLPEMLSRVCQLAVDTFGARMAWVGLVEEGTVEIRPLASAGYDEGYTSIIRVSRDDSPTGMGPTGMAIKTRKPVLRNDIMESPAYSPWREEALKRGYRSSAAFPLVKGEQVLGALNLYWDHPRGCREEEIPLLESFASHAAAMVDNAILFEETQKQVAYLSALTEVSRSLRSAKTQSDMFPIILRSTLKVLKAQGGILFLLEPEKEVLKAVAIQGLPLKAEGLILPVGKGIAGFVVKSGEPEALKDISADPRLVLRRIFKNFHGAVCAPLTTAEKKIGALLVLYEKKEMPAREVVNLLATIGDISASAIQRAGLLEQLLQKLNELATLYEVSRNLTSTLRVQNVLDLVANMIAKALQVEACLLYLWEEKEGKLVLRAASDPFTGAVGKLRVKSGEGLTGWAYEQRTLASASDVSSDFRWKSRLGLEQALPSGRARSALSVPLIHQEKCLGALTVINRIGGNTFSSGDEALLGTLTNQVAIALHNALLFEEVHSLSRGVIYALASAIDARDPYTRGHSAEVTHLCLNTAKQLGWTSSDLELLEYAALLHDIGKIGIPDQVLQKKSSLTPEEWELIRLHPYIGASILKPIQPLWKIIPWIYYHQERWDGKGYPEGLMGEAIPQASRIIAVCDAYNAMVTDRPYRKAMSQEEAIKELEKHSGTQFDPEVVPAFIQVLQQESSAAI